MGNHRPVRPPAFVEPLESRQLLSASSTGVEQQRAFLRELDGVRDGGFVKKLRAAIVAGLSAGSGEGDATTSPTRAQSTAVSADALQAAAVAASPELPRVFLDTTYAPNPAARVITVPAGGNVQNAINAAVPGDTIELAAGATFNGNFTLPNKTGSGWITIRTSTPDANLPAPGTRITPAQSALMPKLVSLNNTPALATNLSAHHYRIIGVEFTIGAAVTESFGIVNLGTSTQTAANTANNLILDRVYIHGRPGAQIQNGIRLNSASTAIIDSYFDQIQSTIFEGHCIGGYNGPGPYKIVNNTFNGGTIPVIFGGAAPSVVGLIPSDLEIRGNHFTRPLSWRPGDPSYAGTEWYVKNLFELKNAQRVLFDGNLLEHNWPHTGTTPDGSPQHGFAILLTVRASGDNGAIVSDVTLTNNIIRKSNVGISISGTEAQGTKEIRIANNLFDDIGLNWGNNDRTGMWMQVQTVGDLQVDHNTVVNDGDIMFANGNEVGDLDFTNNIVKHDAARTINNNRGINAPGVAVGNASLEAKFVQYDVTKNVMVDATPLPSYPAGNFFPATFGAVGFTNLAARDYRLAAASAYRNAGTDGTDIGANFDTLNRATAGAVSGSWPQPVQDIQVNAAEAQRSMVTQMVVTFNQPVTFATGAVALAQRGGGSVNLVVTPSSDQRTYTLTFSGAAITGGSLADGIYDFLVDVSGLRDAFGTVPVGANTLADPTRVFHRLFGDQDGDKDVDGVDSLRFRQSQGSTTGQTAYRAYFDFDADGDIDGVDSLRFRQRQGTALVY
jgi:hypothetical protein